MDSLNIEQEQAALRERLRELRKMNSHPITIKLTQAELEAVDRLREQREKLNGPKSRTATVRWLFVECLRNTGELR